MRYSFHPEAEDEFNEAITYYEGCLDGLGFDLSLEAYTSIQNASDYPHMWPEVEEEVHRCLVHRFPYGILYSIEPDGIFILAVMHLNRDPDYWKHRLNR